jgi:transcription initiation factor TFIIE subunit alpha
VQLKPLIDQLGRVKDLPVPEFGSLQAWEAQAGASVRAANGDNAGDSKCHLGYNGAPMPCSGDTKVTLCCFKGIIISGLHSIRNKKLREVSDP